MTFSEELKTNLGVNHSAQCRNPEEDWGSKGSQFPTLVAITISFVLVVGLVVLLLLSIASGGNSAIERLEDIPIPAMKLEDHPSMEDILEVFAGHLANASGDEWQVSADPALAQRRVLLFFQGPSNGHWTIHAISGVYGCAFKISDDNEINFLPKPD